MGKFLLTGSIVILLILLQTEKIASRVRFPFRNLGRLFRNRAFKTGNLRVNKPAYSYSFKPRNAVPPPPSPRDNRQGYPFIFGKPGDLSSFWDKLRNAAPPPRDSPQNPSYPFLFGNLENFTSFLDNVRNAVPPPPTPGDNRQGYPFIFGKPGDRSSFWDNLRNAAPPPRDSPQNPSYPFLFGNLENFTSFLDNVRNAVPPPPTPGDNRQGYPFIFGKPGDRSTFWDNLRNAAPPPWDSPQNPSYPFLFGNLENFTSFLDNVRNAVPPPPTPGDNRREYPFIFGKPGDRSSFWDNLRNAAPPPRDSPQNPSYPFLFGNLENFTSFLDNVRNAVPPPPTPGDNRQGYPFILAKPGNLPSFWDNLQNAAPPPLLKLKDMIEAANEFAEANQGFHTLFSSSQGGNSRPHDGNPADSKPKGDEVKYVGETVTNAPVEDSESYILGSPIVKMFFRFNDSEEERWWNENRHRFATHVYHPNSSQPISRDVFLNECVNVTVGEYVKPTGNQTEDELEAKVVTQVANEKCMEMYPRLTVLTTAGSYYNNKPEGATILEIKRFSKEVSSRKEKAV
ncbi:uncharacterized protein [Erythrolamprus reginae]|uniref:uncharacterized protein n=1 Tax=Erythrolamprus reginae TaxID=121349 RepID=UPI00396C94A8